MNRIALFKVNESCRTATMMARIALGLFYLIACLMSVAPAQTSNVHRIKLEDGRQTTGEAPDRITPAHHLAGMGAAMSIPNLASSTIPNVYSLEQFQTAFRNQGDRGTCWAFAGAAAMEAAYLRKYNLRLDLSEQYIFHIPKAMEFIPSDFPTNNSSLEANQGSSDIVALLTKFAVPEEPYAPYLSGAQMDQLRQGLGVGNILSAPTEIGYDTFEFSEGHIPTIARWNARYRVTSYGQVSNAKSISELEGLLAANKEVVISVDLKWKPNTTSNIYEYDSTAAGGDHVFVLVGYDRWNSLFLVKNSWGENQFIRVTYDFIRNCARSAHYINDVSDPNAPPQNKARFLGFHDIDETIGGIRRVGRVVIRRFTLLRGEEPAEFELGSFYPADGSASLRITGYFINNGDGVVLKIHYWTGSQWSFHTITYDWGFWRIIDKNYLGTVQVGTPDRPFRNFIDGALNVPRKGEVIVRPGSYSAVGVYSKPMTLKAPSGGVILGW